MGRNLLGKQFRLPARSAHQAVAQAQKYLEEGYTWVVDMDLEKFFDRVQHDVLMSRVARRVADKRLLKLIRAFLNSGVMIDGLFSATPEGTPGHRREALVVVRFHPYSRICCWTT